MGRGQQPIFFKVKNSEVVMKAGGGGGCTWMHSLFAKSKEACTAYKFGICLSIMSFILQTCINLHFYPLLKSYLVWIHYLTPVTNLCTNPPFPRSPLPLTVLCYCNKQFYKSYNELATISRNM